MRPRNTREFFNHGIHGNFLTTEYTEYTEEDFLWVIWGYQTRLQIRTQSHPSEQQPYRKFSVYSVCSVVKLGVLS